MASPESPSQDVMRTAEQPSTTLHPKSWAVSIALVPSALVGLLRELTVHPWCESVVSWGRPWPCQPPCAHPTGLHPDLPSHLSVGKQSQGRQQPLEGQGPFHRDGSCLTPLCLLLAQAAALPAVPPVPPVPHHGSGQADRGPWRGVAQGCARARCPAAVPGLCRAGGNPTEAPRHPNVSPKLPGAGAKRRAGRQMAAVLRLRPPRVPAGAASPFPPATPAGDRALAATAASSPALPRPPARAARPALPPLEHPPVLRAACPWAPMDPGSPGEVIA